MMPVSLMDAPFFFRRSIAAPFERREQRGFGGRFGHRDAPPGEMPQRRRHVRAQGDSGGICKVFRQPGLPDKPNKALRRAGREKQRGADRAAPQQRRRLRAQTRCRDRFIDDRAPHPESGPTQTAREIARGGAGGGMENVSRLGLEPRRRQFRQSGGVALRAFDRGEARGLGGARGRVADREKRQIAPRASAGKNAHAVGAGEQQRLCAAQRRVDPRARFRLGPYGQQRLDHRLDAARGKRFGQRQGIRAWPRQQRLHRAARPEIPARKSGPARALSSAPASWPSAAASRAAPSRRTAWRCVPSGVITSPSRINLPPARVASAPSGVRQSPPSAASSARSAATQLSVAGSLTGASKRRARSSLSRISTPIPPSAGPASISAGSRMAEIASVNPSRRNPATASIVAPMPDDLSLSMRVPTLPRRGTIFRSGRAKSASAWRRSELVPSVAFSGKVASPPPPPRIAAPRGSPRGSRQDTARPAADAPSCPSSNEPRGRSLRP